MSKYFALSSALLVLFCAACAKVPQSSPTQQSQPQSVAQSTTSEPSEPPRHDQSQVARDKYLQSVIGISEDKLINAFNDPDSPLPAKLATQDAKGFFTITNVENNKTYKAGKFEFTKTVKNLIDESAALTQPGLGTFSIIDGSAFPKGQVKEVDVAWLQAQPQNRLAVFQVASNQNGLEQISANTSVEAQRLEAYPGDPTQGPIASISAAPGILVRWGYAYFDLTTKPNTWRQLNAHQLNFLENLPALPVNQAGYVMWDKTPTIGPAADDYQKIKIGYHEGIQVTFGREDNGHYPFLSEPEQLIDQVFCAAIAVAYQGAKVNTQSPIVASWSQEMLKGIYEGTIRYARLKDRKKLYLTSVGGGVFGNKQDWIDSAIVRMKDYIVVSGLKVVFVNYAGALSPRLLPLVNDTGGCYQQFDPQGKIIKSSGKCE